jgi:CheY-like chemotaxis protein
MPCKGCILLVDDDRDVRDTLAECFGGLGCTVVTAADGVEAMQRLGESLTPCFVLLDVNMPRLGGAELAAFIRAHPAHCALPLFSMTAGTDRLEPPLVDCHHQKPFSFETLVPLVESCCQDRDWLHGHR